MGKSAALQQGVAHLGGSPWAIGLLWVLAEGEDRLPREARRHAAQLGEQAETSFDLAAYRRYDTAIQIGLASSAIGHAKGMVPLAQAVGDVLGTEWLACLPLGHDRFWIGGCASAVIGTDADRVVYGESDAWAAFHELQSMYGDGKTYVPRPWLDEVDGAACADDLVPLLVFDKSARLKRLTGPLAAVTAGLQLGRQGAAAIALLALVGGAGTAGWWTMTEEDREMERLLRQAQSGKPEVGPQRQVVEARPWLGAPLPGHVLAACAARDRDLRGVMIPGWDLISTTCTGNEAGWSIVGAWQSAWGHHGIALDGAGPALQAAGLEGPVAEAGEHVTVTLDVPVQPRLAPEERAAQAEAPLSQVLFSEQSVRKWLYYFDSVLEAEVSFTGDFAVRETVARTGDVEVVTRTPGTVTWNGEMPYVPSEVVAALHRLPGAVIDRVEFTHPDGRLRVFGGFHAHQE